MLLMLIVPKGLCSVYNIDFSQCCVFCLFFIVASIYQIQWKCNFWPCGTLAM